MFVITGGGSGIGQALAQSLVTRDKHVCVVGRREAPLAALARTSSLIDYFCVDISSSAGREKLFDYLQSNDELSGLIHNAGVIDPIAPLSDLHVNEWQHAMATNVEAPLFLTQACLPLLTDGRVLNIGSGAAYFPIASWASYCMSKAALAMLTRCWQLEHPQLACTSVMPGIIDTPMQEKIRQATSMETHKHDFFMCLKQEKRLLSPETVALFLTWLLLDVDTTTFRAQEWDIYDESHHANWLVSPHVVPRIE